MNNIPTIQVNGVPHRPLLPGVKAFDESSINRLDRSDSTHDVFGLPISSSNSSTSNKNSEDRKNSTEHHKRALSRFPNPEQDLRELKRRKVQSVTFGQPYYTLMDERQISRAASNNSLQDERPVSRAASFAHTEFSFCGNENEASFPPSNQEKAAIEAKWRDRVQQRHTMDLSLMRERIDTDNLQVNRSSELQRRPAVRNAKEVMSRRSRTPGLLGRFEWE